MSQTRLRSCSRPRFTLRLAVAPLVVLSIGLASGCTDSPSKDPKMLDRPDGKAPGPGSFQPNVKTAKEPTKAEPL